MESKQQPLMGILIVAFLIMIIGVALLQETSTAVKEVTFKTSVALEQHTLEQTDGAIAEADTHNYTVSKAPTGWKAGGECPLTNFKVTNSSGDELTLTTDYTVDLETGKFALVNNDDVNLTSNTYGLFPTNITYVSYDYCPDTYQKGWGGTVLNLVPGFIALAILMAVAFVILWILKKEGVDV
jgi:hypothetical protein